MEVERHLPPQAFRPPAVEIVEPETSWQDEGEGSEADGAGECEEVVEDGDGFSEDER